MDIRISSSSLPPTFLLPNRARYFNSTPQIIDSPIESSETPPPSALKVSKTTYPKPSAVNRFVFSPKPQPPPQPPSPDTLEKKPLSDSTKELLPLLLAQSSHFISAHIHGRPYLVTQGDILRLPFLMPNVAPGDVLRLNRASSIGSRDYTLKGTPYLDERLFVCRATVMGTEGEPVRVKEKTTQRNRRVHTTITKLKFTVLRISELSIQSLEDIEEEPVAGEKISE